MNLDRLFHKVASLWNTSSISQVDSPSRHFSLFSPLLSVLLLLTSPSYFNPNSPSPSQSIQDLFDWTLDNQDPDDVLREHWHQQDRCPKRLKEFFEQGLLKKKSEDGKHEMDLGLKEITALIIVLRMREAIVKAWPRESQFVFRLRLKCLTFTLPFLLHISTHLPYHFPAVIGFPKVISPLGALTSHFQSRFPDLSSLLFQLESRPLELSPSPSNHIDIDTFPSSSTSTSTSTSNTKPSRGLSLFQSTYSKHSSKVLDSLNHSHPSLPSSALNLIYQPLLSDDSILNPHPFSTSLICLIVCLASHLEPQAKGHFGGAKNCVKKNEELKNQEGHLEGVEMEMVVLAVKTTALLIEELKLGPSFEKWEWLPKEVLDYVKELKGSDSA